LKTTAGEVCSIDNILRDTTPREEPGLIGIHKRVDGALESRGEHLCDSLHDTILEGNWPEERGMVSSVYFWEEDQEGPVDSCEVNGTIVEGGENSKNVRRDQAPKGGEEGGAEAIRPGARLFVHVREGLADLVVGKRSTEGGREGPRVVVEISQVKPPLTIGDRPEEGREEIFKNNRFLKVGGGSDTIDLQRGDGVTSKATRSRGVKKLHASSRVQIS
jgi:hypothetical protein